MGVEQVRWLGLSWLAGVNCRAPLFALAPLLPLAMRDLGMSFTLGGAVTGMPLLLMGLLSLPGGWLADHLGARRTVALASTGIALAAVGRAVAPDGFVLLASTLLLGAAIGVAQPALARAARELLPERVSLASSVYFNGLLLGGVGSAAATPYLLGYLGGGGENWRAALLLWATIALASAVGWGWVARGPGGASRPAVAGGWLQPLREAASIPGVPALTLVLGTQSAIFYTFSNWAPSYLTQRGWPLEAVGVPLLLLGFGTLVAGLVTVAVQSRLGSRWAIVLSGMAVAAGIAVFLVWPDQTAWLCALLVGAGTTMAFGITLAAPSVLAPAHRVGTTAGLMLAFGYVESAIGPMSIGALRDAFGSYELGWWLLLGFALVLVAAGLAVPGGPAPAPAET